MTPSRSSKSSQFIDENDTIEGAPHLLDAHLAVFDCAFKPANGTRSIHYQGHLKMMGAVQPFISGAISKTINMPANATVEEIEQAYYEAWKLGLKAVAVYRDGCKRSQPLSTAKDKSGLDQLGVQPTRGQAEAPRRARGDHAQVLHRRPRGLHHGRQIRGRNAGRDLHHHGQGRLDDLRPDGLVRHDDVAGLTARRAAAAAWSTSSRTCASSRSGFTRNPEIPMAKSIMDYIFKWLAIKFLPRESQAEAGVILRDEPKPGVGQAFQPVPRRPTIRPRSPSPPPRKPIRTSPSRPRKTSPSSTTSPRR